ncbi:hypothetical protein E1A91_A06G080400v1 [Gossypium mustelinum]|uniref:GRDP C2 domain-containing protein n=1 Tax=Gossypium mustelinum TaxID=34275 RepID=A0A5D2YUS5_GOSMU|nr:hypothetical protein E1A91_A06G080400v1 [Gossypium mustelinum]
MERGQELEWEEAQKLAISVDLVTSAKQHLRFLAEVDRNRTLYDGPILDRAIYRYKHYWLPLLGKHTESTILEGPLVVPLDCEWIWHCHKLNPVRYKADCEELYGRILDNKNVMSAISTTCRRQTEEIWKRMYPYEPYELNMSSQFLKNFINSSMSTHYDLVSAVKRQSPFFTRNTQKSKILIFYFPVLLKLTLNVRKKKQNWKKKTKVSGSHMNDDVFLEGAVARYKGFLHLIKRNWENSKRCFCVPTYDIDLIWHTHQLYPVSYCKDVMAALGKILEHDDTDSDRTKGKKLDTGFSRTTKQWEDMFGCRYWRAGAMYRGQPPSPLGLNLSQLDNQWWDKKMVPSNENQDMVSLHRKTVMEDLKGSLFVTINKKQPDVFLNNKRNISILCNTKEKQAIVFQCEPKGDLVIELMSYSPIKTLGTTSISLKGIVNSVSRLYAEEWFDLVPDLTLADSKPISVRIAFSFTPPILAHYMVQMVRHFKYHCFTDEANNDIISLQMRDYQTRKEVIGLTSCGGTHVLAAESAEKGWFLNNSHWRFHVHNELNENDIAFGFKGNRKISEEEPLVVPMIILAFLVSESSSNCGKSCNNEGKGGGEAITNGIKDSPPDGEDEVKSSNCDGCGGGCGVSCGGSCGGHCSGGDAYRN